MQALLPFPPYSHGAWVRLLLGLPHHPGERPPAGGGHGGDVGNVMCLYTALSMSFPFQCPAFPPGCKGQHPEPVQRGFHTTGPEPIHAPGGHTTLPGCGRWSRPPTECVSTPSPREPSATLHNGQKMPMEGFGVFQVRDKEECKRLGPGGHQGGITRL